MFYDISKRLLDILSVFVLGIIFSPFLIAIPILLVLQKSGPIFYKQRRVGQYGKQFTLYKFRTMIQNADQKLMQDKKLQARFKNQKGGWKIPVSEDPRITPIGKIIRQLTLDEFPQLINVLKGEMSLVGPRPYRKDEVGDEIKEQLKKHPELKEEIQVLLSVKPGITGPWQTSGRNDIPWEQQIKLGADYARRRSILFDIYIILKTPFAMLSKW